MNSLYTKNTVVDKDNPIDVLLSYEMQSGTVTGLQLDDTILTAGTDYEQTEDTITVSASVFSDVATGEHTIQLLTSEGNQPKVKIRVYSAAEEAQKRSVIDDFESYGEDTALAAAYTTNVNGDTLKISLDAEHTKNGSYAMKYDYSVADGGAGYCGATKKLSNADWTGFDGVRFWILSDGSNRETTFQFVDGAGAYWESIQKVTAETGWQEVKIPFSDFHVQQWGTAAETPTLQGVSEFSIYTGQNGNPGTGVWYFDDIGLYRAGSTTTTTTTTTGTTTTTTTTTTTAETTTDADTDTNYGDVNLDGKVDLVDAIMINKYLAGQITLSEQAAKNADVNADGSLGDGDSTILMRFILMVIPNLPYVE